MQNYNKIVEWTTDFMNIEILSETYSFQGKSDRFHNNIF